MAAETVAQDMTENVTEEGVETEIVTVKVAETKEVVKKLGLKKLQWAKMGLNWSKNANYPKTMHMAYFVEGNKISKQKRYL